MQIEAQAKWLENTRDFPGFITKRKPVGDKTEGDREKGDREKGDREKGDRLLFS